MVREDTHLEQVNEESDGMLWGVLGEGFEARVPENDWWGIRVLEDLMGVWETGSEGTDEGNTG